METAADARLRAARDMNAARAQRTRKRTRIQEENEEKILDAGLEVFSTWGYRGATVDQIAALAGMTKPNLLYYFRRKEDIYLAVLNRTHEMWLEPLEHLDADGDPAGEIAAYIDRKLETEPRQPESLAAVRHGDHPGRPDPRRDAPPAA